MIMCCVPSPLAHQVACRAATRGRLLCRSAAHSSSSSSNSSSAFMSSPIVASASASSPAKSSLLP
eukprot:366181-Chlamydomonas_euryale.AAC.7